MPESYTYSVFRDKKSALYLLYCNNILCSGIEIQSDKNIVLISQVDTTGYKRKCTLRFIVYVLRRLNIDFAVKRTTDERDIEGNITIDDMDKRNKRFKHSDTDNNLQIVYVFTNPRKELIFGKSSKNSNKKILDSQELFKFWVYCFKNRCIHSNDLFDVRKSKEYLEKFSLLEYEKNSDNTNDNIKRENIRISNKLENNNASHSNRNKNLINGSCIYSTWSNYSKSRAYPFKIIDDLPDFEDDPISKFKSHFNNITDLFEGLLIRKDFMNGGLVFSICTTDHDYSNISIKDLNTSRKMNYNTRELKLDEKHVKNPLFTVTDVIKFLRTLNFSDDESIAKSSTAFNDKFNLAQNEIELDKISLINEPLVKDVIKTVVPRSKL